MTAIFQFNLLRSKINIFVFSVAVTRSRNIPRFGPPIPENAMFSCSSTFREFLLTKVINGENTAHMAGKFKVSS